MLESNKTYCCYCGKYIDGKDIKATNEHLIPISVGGNNSPENIRICCMVCNNLRANMSLYSFNYKMSKSNISKYDKEIYSENISYIQEYISQNGSLLYSDVHIKMVKLIKKMSNDDLNTFLENFNIKSPYKDVATTKLFRKLSVPKLSDVIRKKPKIKKYLNNLIIKKYETN